MNKVYNINFGDFELKYIDRCINKEIKQKDIRNYNDFKITYANQKNKNDTDPYVNIHCFSKKINKYTNKHMTHGSINETDIFPLKLYKFGNIELCGINNA